MVIAVVQSISRGPCHPHLYHMESIGCSTSYGVTSTWLKSPSECQRLLDHSGISSRCTNLFFGATHSHWLPVTREICSSKVSVAADHSDSVPDSSDYVSNHGYHPLEEVKVCKRVRDTKLTSAETARTAVEANSSALLIFPSAVHSEPHEHISWAEFQYIIDEYGDIFFEIFDDKNILQDFGASSPVNALIGLDMSIYQNKRVAASEYIIAGDDVGDDSLLGDDYLEVEGSETSQVSVEWGMPMDTTSEVHPIYFAKCLTKAVDVEYTEKMDNPSNGVSILGCLRPAFMDEVLYLQRLGKDDDSGGYLSEWKDDEFSEFCLKEDKNRASIFYRLEIMKIELFSVYGVQSTVRLQEFQEAEPDVLVHSMMEMVERFNEKGSRYNFALKALCKKKGLHVEGASLIGVDSLGMDVRVFSGTEVNTHRFPFKAEATSEAAAEKQIRQLLFPPARRKRLRTRVDEIRELDPL